MDIHIYGMRERRWAAMGERGGYNPSIHGSLLGKEERLPRLEPKLGKPIWPACTDSEIIGVLITLNQIKRTKSLL